MQNRFRSLRVRLLFPLVAVALLVSVGVAVGSYVLGDRWAQEDLEWRYEGIRATLSHAAYPLTQAVIDSLAKLTDTELITLGERGQVIVSSLEDPNATVISRLVSTKSPISEVVTVDARSFRYAVIDRDAYARDGATRVLVFFEERKLREARLRAASLPLITGLSTIVLLTSVTLFVTNRLISRLSRLQQQVNKIAMGDFQTQIPVGPSDEVGLLAASVQQMNDQLKRMWTTLRRQQGQKLLHQLAGGLAHQLRNSITGARMAVELHRQECTHPDDSLEVAISQLEQTEISMKRLLIVASGKQEVNQPQSLGCCLAQAQHTLSATADHLRVDLNWQMDRDLDRFQIADGPSLNSAITNLVLNALQVATNVSVIVDCGPQQVVISVKDNGPGPPESVADEIFEPFVTSKPEGLGLGLPLVAESVKRLGGSVEWRREDGHTCFSLSAPIRSTSPSEEEN